MNRINIPAEITPVDDSAEPVVILFDIETGGFYINDEILQIVAKSKGGNPEFSVYILPTKSLNPKASLVNKLYVSNGCLEYDGQRVDAVSLQEAMSQFYNFLTSFNKKCILTAHNCKTFDGPRIIRAIHSTNMNEHFKSVVVSFCDTLHIIKSVTKKNKKGENKLGNIATCSDISIEGAHDALCDVKILDEI